MKKFIAAALACLLAISLCACVEVPDDTPTDPPVIGDQTPNPMSEATAESLIADVGIDMSVAEQFENVSYYKIDAEVVTAAEARFERDGVKYDFRAAPADDAQDISGMNYQWTEETTADIKGLEGSIRLSSDGAGVIDWFDAVPGIMYSLSADKDASADALAETAAMLYVPVQGDAEGDIEEGGTENADAGYDADFGEKFNALLDEIRQNYHPGTAGSSLTAARYTAELADLFAEYKPDPAQVKAQAEAYIEQMPEADEEIPFDEIIRGFADSFEYINSDEGKGILEDCGYESAGLEWDESVAEAFNALR